MTTLEDLKKGRVEVEKILLESMGADQAYANEDLPKILDLVEHLEEATPRIDILTGAIMGYVYKGFEYSPFYNLTPDGRIPLGFEIRPSGIFSTESQKYITSGAVFPVRCLLLADKGDYLIKCKNRYGVFSTFSVKELGRKKYELAEYLQKYVMYNGIQVEIF